MGLWALKSFKKDEKIVEYKGERLTVAQYDKRYHEEAMGSYGIDLDDNHVLDARRTDSGMGRWACDYHGSGRKANAEYVVDDDDRVWVVAIRPIKAGDEILTDYGDEMHRALGL